MKVKKRISTPEGEGQLDIDLTIQEGEFVTFYGHSGAGKTMLLRMLAGLTDPDEGMIEYKGQLWFDHVQKINIPVQQRKVGFVFQEYSLFPNMTVRQNLEFALTDQEQYKSVDQWLEVMGLTGLQHQNSVKLSGGQKQRVALVRALVNSPRILLLDEPLSALDSDLRLKLQEEIVTAYQKTKITTILVSHDRAEVTRLSGRVFVIEQGRVTKIGQPKEIFIPPG